ncbi:MAG: hypothetical protein J6P60_03505 [Lachnospiraceae bacterium]|nr:hypothetical protein [Lachnospiraceae bacterium]
MKIEPIPVKLVIPCKAVTLSGFTEKPGWGTLSENRIQNMKYHFVITTALLARYCIEDGLELSVSYGLSDFYIQKADRAKSIAEISALHTRIKLDA